MNWAAELLSSDFGDVRLSFRLVRLMEQLSAHPEASIPEACGSRKAMKGAYRLLSNPAVTPQRIWQPHVERTALRAAQFPTVLAGQDTTPIGLTAHETDHGVGDFRAPRGRARVG